MPNNFNPLRWIGLERASVVDSSIKSFESVYKGKLDLMDKALGACSNVNDNHSTFNPKSIVSTNLADYPIFAHNYAVIKAKTLDRTTYLKSKYKNIDLPLIEDQITDIGFDKKFFENVFDILYQGCGVFLNLLYEGKIITIPFWEKGEELVQVTTSRYSQEITKIKVQSNLFDKTKMGYTEIDLVNTKYYIGYNQKQGSTYLSNILIATPYITLQNKLTARDGRFADENFDQQNIISPKFDSIIPNKSTGSFDVTLGGDTFDFVQFVSDEYPAIKKQIDQQLKKERTPILPIGVDIKSFTQSNSQNQTNLIRTWLDEMIVISCFSSSSISGKAGVANRSVSEQDRDNLEENTILIFQSKLANIVNNFILPILLPHSHKDFSFEFYREATDETLAIQAQKLKSFELLMNPLARQLITESGLILDKDQVVELFQSVHGINLINQSQNAGLANQTDNVIGLVENQIALEQGQPIKKVFTLADISKKINFLDFQIDIKKSKEYLNILDAFRGALTRQYTNIANQKNNQTKAEIDPKNNFASQMSADDFQRQMDAYHKKIWDAYQLKLAPQRKREEELLARAKQVPQAVIDARLKAKIYQEYLKVKEKYQKDLDRKTKLQYEGGYYVQIDSKGNAKKVYYKGFDETQKKEIQGLFNITTNQIEQLVQADIARLEANLFVPLFSEIYQGFAISDGATWVGTIAKNDRLVRDWHLNNSGTAFRIGGKMKDPKNPRFYLEPNCRCSRVYGTRDELAKAGFEIIEDPSQTKALIKIEYQDEIKVLSSDLQDEIYTKYKQSVNMSYSELENWSNNPKSRLASLDRSPITRNLRLLSKKKDEWTANDFTDANKTIAFIARMSKGQQGENIRVNGQDIGISKRDISLMNWAYNPKK